MGYGLCADRMKGRPFLSACSVSRCGIFAAVTMTLPTRNPRAWQPNAAHVCPCSGVPPLGVRDPRLPGPGGPEVGPVVAPRPRMSRTHPGRGLLAAIEGPESGGQTGTDPAQHRLTVASQDATDQAGEAG